jgi:hypothetical protein
VFHKLFDAIIHVLVVALKQAISEVQICPAQVTGKCPLEGERENGLGGTPN